MVADPIDHDAFLFQTFTAAAPCNHTQIISHQRPQMTGQETANGSQSNEGYGSYFSFLIHPDSFFHTFILI